MASVNGKIFFSDQHAIRVCQVEDAKSVFPSADRRNTLITSALPYVNNLPHLGTIIGCVLSGDVFSRYARARGDRVLYVCGTDEYGTATETKALQEQTTPQAICDKYYALQKTVYEWFNIRFDNFGRTTTEKQTEIAQDIFLKLHKNGLTRTKTIEQLHCGKCDMFLADRYVEGVCPHCAYEDARGDQCDKCQKLLNPTDLKQPRCKVCTSTPSLRQSDHIFLDLSSLQPRVEAHLQAQWAQGADCYWSQNAIAITKSWLKEGLKERCITRDLKWGTRVPLKEFDKKVFYVWFDAPIGYISITANLTPHWKKWWLDVDEKIDYYNFLGKDNVPFHAIIFPASLLGTGDKWTLVNHMCATEYLNYEDTKFSKSRGTGVFGDQVKDTGIPADIWRFYLLVMRPESQDTSFNWDDFAARINNELLNNLGNFIQRSLSFCAARLGGVVGKIEPEALLEVDWKMLDDVNGELAAFRKQMDSVHLRDAVLTILNISRIGNQYFQSTEPWVQVKGSEVERARASLVIGLSCQIVHLLAAILHPFMPETSKQICSQLGVDLKESTYLTIPHEFTVTLKAGHKLGSPTPLFRKIEADEVKRFRQTYAGKAGSMEPTGTGVEDAKKDAKKGGVKKCGTKVPQNSNKSAAADSSQAAALVSLLQSLSAEQLTQYKAKLASIEQLEFELAPKLAELERLQSAQNVSNRVEVDLARVDAALADLVKHQESLKQKAGNKVYPMSLPSSSTKAKCLKEEKKNDKEEVKKELQQQKSTSEVVSSKEVKETTKKSAAASGEENLSVDISRIDLRVGFILSAQKHPDADGLYVEQIDLGEAKPRTIVSGLVKHVPLEEMQNRACIVMCNLKPAKMRGVESQGMVMCASTPDRVEILAPPKGAKPGQRLICKEFPGEPDSQLNPKKKVWESVAPDLKVDSKGRLNYKEALLNIDGEFALAPTLTDVNVK